VVPYVLDARNLVQLKRDVCSPSIDLTLNGTQKVARFSLKLLRGGFLHKLEGEMIDGSDWPLKWSSDDTVANTTSLPNWLPATMSAEERTRILDRLAQWLGLSPSTLADYDEDQLLVESPCGDSETNTCEDREGIPLPAEYRAFVRITNGLDVICMKPFSVL